MPRFILNFFFIIEHFPPLSIKLYDNHEEKYDTLLK